MGYNFKNASGNFRFNIFAWPCALTLAKNFDWKPMGTVLRDFTVRVPDGLDISNEQYIRETVKEWDGDYCVNELQLVLEEDALRAISLMDRMLETVGVDVRTGKVDPGVFHGRPSSDQAILTKSIEVFNSLTGTERKAVDEKILIDEIIAKLKISEDEAKRAIKLMYDSGTIFEVKKGSWRRL